MSNLHVPTYTLLYVHITAQVCMCANCQCSVLQNFACLQELDRSDRSQDRTKIDTYIHIHTYTHTQIYTRTHTYTHTQVYTRTHIHTHTYTHTFTHTQIYTRTHINTHIHKYTHVSHIQTHIHARAVRAHSQNSERTPAAQQDGPHVRLRERSSRRGPNAARCWCRCWHHFFCE
jgi:hypothetical protein